MSDNNQIISAFYQMAKSTVNQSSQMLHVGSVLICLLFNDLRGLLIFFGLLSNSLINLGLKHLLTGSDISTGIDESCNGCGNFFSKCSTNNSMPTENVQTFAFFATFIISIMIFNKKFRLLSLLTLISLLVIICYVSISSECSDYSQIMVAIFIGLILGYLYAVLVNGFYYPVKDDNDLAIFPMINNKIKKVEENEKKYICKAYRNGVEINHI